MMDNCPPLIRERAARKAQEGGGKGAQAQDGIAGQAKGKEAAN